MPAMNRFTIGKVAIDDCRGIVMMSVYAFVLHALGEMSSGERKHSK